MDAPKELIERMNVGDKFAQMFLAYFRRNIGNDIQYLSMFDLVDISKDSIAVSFREGASTGSEFPKTESTGWLEEKSFDGNLSVVIRCKRRTFDSKTQILQRVAEVRALMLRGILFKSTELLSFAEVAVIAPPKFQGVEFDADDDGDSASLSWSFEFNLSPEFFKLNKGK